MKPNRTDLPCVSTDLEHLSAQAVIAWAADTYGSRLCLVTGLDDEGCVLALMLREVAPVVSVFMSDLDDEDPATHELRLRLERDHGVRVRLVRPSFATASFECDFGPLEYWGPHAISRLRRWEPLRAQLKGYGARLGARRRQCFPDSRMSATVTWDESLDMVLINPLARWDTAQVAEYLRARGVEPPTAAAMRDAQLVPPAEPAHWLRRWGRLLTGCLEL